MCQAAQCEACGKTTWAGCGQHVRDVMSKVPLAEQCTCRGPAVGAETSRPGWRSRLRVLLSRP